MTFQKRFCQRFNTPIAQFETKLFRACLYRHALTLAGLIDAINPGFFEEDLEVIQQIAYATSSAEVESELRHFRSFNRMSDHWLRTKLRIRLSGKRLARIVHQVFDEAGTRQLPS
jgi:hypothetical protein